MNIKDKAIFLAEVAFALVIIGMIQKNVYKLPVVGDYLPGA